MGVCFPSFAGAAGASRWAMNVAACSSTTALPFVIKYARSFGPSAKRRLNGDCANTSKSSSRLRTRLRIDCRGKSRSRRTRYFLTREWHHPLFQSMLATRLRPLNATDACSCAIGDATGRLATRVLLAGRSAHEATVIAARLSVTPTCQPAL